MSAQGLEGQITALLAGLNLRGGYPLSLVCTDQGLLVASHGQLDAETLAGFTSLFDDIVARAARDLGLSGIDEVTLLDPRRGRFVLRPLQAQGERRFFLVALVPSEATWRRNTNQTSRELEGLLRPLAESP